tara:strand:- start:812 stop:1921 length:1110 start_codon:yes stop_codon:yes gene_type:complete
MPPLIQDKVLNENTLEFTFSNMPVCIANAIRRTIISDIPTVVFKGFPHAECNINIDINTSNFNNEIVKHRISCIPIHISDPLDFNTEMYIVELDVQNDTDTIIIASTGDFKVKDISTNTYLPESEVKKIFPPDSITGEFIDIVRLKPIADHGLSGEHIKLSAKLTLGIAKENSCWNVVSTCVFKNTPDNEEIQKVWNSKEKALDSSISASDKKQLKDDFMNLDAERIFIPNSFDFIIESLGIFTCESLMVNACKILIEKIKVFCSSLDKDNNLIQERMCAMPFSYQLELQNEDYTFGKVLEYILYTNQFEKAHKLAYISFKKEHPLNKNSLLLISCVNNLQKEEIAKMFIDEATNCISYFETISSEFVG